MSRFNNKVVLITGATSGIGEAAAKAFAAEGAKVVVSGRRSDRGEQVVKSIIDQGGEAFFVRADVAKEEDVKALVDVTLERYGRLDVAFNNAGIESMANVADITEDEYRAIVDTNIGGVVWGMKYEVPALLQSGGGAVINTASIFSQIGMPSMSIYSASKHAVVGLTRTAALEVVKDGIRINAVSPGGVETEMMQRAAGPVEAESEGRQFFRNLHPIGRFSTPEEQAAAVLFLASDEASFVNGANLSVDSGWAIA